MQRILAWVFATAFVLILSIEGAHADRERGGSVDRRPYSILR